MKSYVSFTQEKEIIELTNVGSVESVIFNAIKPVRSQNSQPVFFIIFFYLWQIHPDPGNERRQFHRQNLQHVVEPEIVDHRFSSSVGRGEQGCHLSVIEHERPQQVVVLSTTLGQDGIVGE